MSIAEQLTRLVGLRNRTRTKLTQMGLATNESKLEDCTEAIEGIIDNTQKTTTANAIQGIFDSGAKEVIYAKGLNGYSNENSLVKVPVSNLAPENIREGVNIAGNIGTVKEVKKNSPYLISSYKHSTPPYTMYTSLDRDPYFTRVYPYLFNNKKILAHYVSQSDTARFYDNDKNGAIIKGNSDDGLDSSALLSGTVVGYSKGRNELYTAGTKGAITAITPDGAKRTIQIGTTSQTPDYFMVNGNTMISGAFYNENYSYISTDGGSTWNGFYPTGLPDGDPVRDAELCACEFSEEEQCGFMVIYDSGVTLYRTTDLRNFTKGTSFNNPADWSGISFRSFRHLFNGVWRLECYKGNYYGSDEICTYIVDNNGTLLKEFSYDVFSYGSSSSKYDVNVRNVRYEGLYTKNGNLYMVDKENGYLILPDSYNQPYSIAFVIGVSFYDFLYLPDEHKMILFAYGAQYAIDLPDSI